MGDLTTGGGMTRRELISGAGALAAYAALQRTGLSAATTDPVPTDRIPYGGSWQGLVGVEGGIPARAAGTDIYRTIQPYTGTADTINGALSSCPADKVVQLAPGTFNISASGSGD